ncbi:hst3 protein [Verticillium dahliae VdLs.17]|uniref:Hst3 protein n=1 Tax=Verticillium dahliae (strain VdLs.17 / ATCC MYA-4575 / FGSC 10137) TaxID=498257 RepID=G2XDM3_VERDV|nr:hst3 protein [Verticillium dahliae VdLs.17]EGY17091.1 hst3 protein [Verticillium dahliae VdLs.17]KAH6696024.1 hst3 protein [Verticillium dahliae]
MPTIQVSPDADELLQSVANGILKSRKIIVVTGAGISTNSGIPDFRSENGLYALIQAQFDAANKDPKSPTALTRSNSSTSVGLTESHEDGPPTKRRKLEQTDDTMRQASPGAASSQTQDDQVECLRNGDYVKIESLHAEEPMPRQMTEDHGCARRDQREDADQATGDKPRPTTISGAVSDFMTETLRFPTTNLGMTGPSRAKRHRQSRRRSSWGHSSTSASFLLTATSPKPDQHPRTLHIAPALQTSSTRAASLSPPLKPHYDVDCGRSEVRNAARTRRVSMSSLTHPLDDEILQWAWQMQDQPECPSKDNPSNEQPQDSSPRLPRLPPSLLSSILPVSRSTPKQMHLPFTSSPLSSPLASSQRPRSFLARRKASEVHTPSRLVQIPMAHDSSPLSSPPPVLFDPFNQVSSSTSQQSLSAAGSTTCSETDETPPSSRPSLISQTSNPVRSTLPNIKGRDLFDISIWSDPLRTSVFYTFATTLRQKARDVQPTASHLFISHLRDRGKLVRCYTQNIDQIEEKVGLSTSLQQGPGSRGRFSRKSAGGFSAPSSQGGEGEANESIVKRDAANGGVECVFLHGSLQSLRCFLCGRICEWDEGGRSVETLSGRQPECPHCVGATVAREERGKRALGVGKLRPDIVLYGEEHPNAHLIDPLVKHDLALYPDSLLILGTSLKVHGLKVLVREFAKTVHSKGGKVIFVNFTKPSESSWGDIIDYWIQWDCDAWVSNLQERVPLLWLPPGTKLPVPGKKKRESSGETKAAKGRSSGDAGKPVDTGNPIIPDTKDMDEDSHHDPLGHLEQTSKTAAPRRPQVMREDKHNAAFLTWQIARDLRKITGDESPLVSFTSLQRDARLARFSGSTPSSPTPVVPECSLRTPVPNPTRTAGSHRPSLPSSASCSVLPSATILSRTPLPTEPLPTLATARRALDDHQEAKAGQPPEPESSVATKKRRRDSRRTQKAPSAGAEANVSARAMKKRAGARKQGPGWIYVSEEDIQLGEPVVQAVGQGLVVEAGIEHDLSATIGAAIKANPRKRKRKMIDGEEVILPGSVRRTVPSTPRTIPSKGISRPPLTDTSTPLALPLPLTPAAASPPRLQSAMGISPNIVSDLRRVSMDTMELAPIYTPADQHHQGPVQMPLTPARLVPLEPRSPPSGPLSRISPNMGPFQLNPFKYFDSLVLKLRQPPAWMGWTPGPEEQLKSETDAALALGQMRMGS